MHSPMQRKMCNSSARTLHCAAKSVRKRSGRDASSHHKVVLHGLMPVTGSRRLNCYETAAKAAHGARGGQEKKFSPTQS